jgi:DnaJ family protein A protein 2
MMAVEGEGLPSAHNPMITGNLFLMLNIVFPAKVTPDAQAVLMRALGPKLNRPKWTEDDEGCEVHFAKPADPVASFKENDIETEGATGDDDDDEMGHGGQRVQCAQQ